MDTIEYRQSVSGRIYRRYGTRNEVLTPWGWQLAVFMLGASGWATLVRMTQPVAINPAWPK